MFPHPFLQTFQLVLNLPMGQVCLYAVMPDSATPWTVTRQAFLSMGILQARILEWVATSFSRESSQPGDRTQVSPHCWRILYLLSHQRGQEYSEMKRTAWGIGVGGTSNPCRSLGVARSPTRWPTAIKFLESQEVGCSVSPTVSCPDFALSRQERRGSRVRATQYIGWSSWNSRHSGLAGPPSRGRVGARANQLSPQVLGWATPSRRATDPSGRFPDLQNRKRVWARARARVGGATLPEVPAASGWFWLCTNGARGALCCRRGELAWQSGCSVWMLHQACCYNWNFDQLCVFLKHIAKIPICLLKPLLGTAYWHN